MCLFLFLLFFGFFDIVHCRNFCTFGFLIKQTLQFKTIIGQQRVKQKLVSSVAENRVAHTQLFLGPEGAGSLALAIAFAQYVNCTHKQNGDSCGTCPSCVKYEKFAHPDLHFVFPTTTNDRVKKDPESNLFLDSWRSYLEKTAAYVTQNGWYEHLGVGNKQGTIYARDANQIIKILGLKSYEAEYKVVIVYLAEKLHPSASNKLLKSLEEPPHKTLIILVAERYEMILPTVRSRAQLVKVPALSREDIEAAVAKRSQALQIRVNAAEIASMANGNWNEALALMDDSGENDFYFLKFRDWMRLCFRPGNFIELHAFIQEWARLGREKQKQFLSYGLKVVHHSLLIEQGLTNAVFAHQAEMDYLTKFAPFVHDGNRKQMVELLNEAIYHIERNAHAAILFTDLSFSMVDLLKIQKAG